MNRRSFISDMLKAGVACTFLGAGRIWKPVLKPEHMIQFLIPEPKRLDLEALFRSLYAIQQARVRAGLKLPDPFIEVFVSGTPTVYRSCTKGVYRQLVEA